MRAVVQRAFGGPDVLSVEQVEPPTLLPTEVRVRVVAAGVNPVDAKVRRGLSVARFMGDLPIVLGWDVAGTVESIAPGVTRFAVGDRVMGMPRFPRAAGAYAELATAPARQLARVPDSLDLVTASAIPLPATTAWQIVRDTATIESGQSVLMVGAGGAVGRTAAQLAGAVGAVVTATGSPRSQRLLTDLGVSETFETIDAAALAGRRFDVVVDLVGGETGARAALKARAGGLVVTVPSNPDATIFEAARSVGARATSIIVEPDRGALEGVAALIEAGRLSIAPPALFPLDDVRQVHQLLDDGAPLGKMALAIAD